MPHSSRSPSLPAFVPNETEPSGETSQARAASRSLCGAAPDAGNTQMLLVGDDHLVPSVSTPGWEVATNPLPSGNQAGALISQTTLSPRSASGCGTSRDSSAPTALRCTPLESE